MGWWTQQIADGKRRREEQALRQEVCRLESFRESPQVLTALGRLHEWLDDPPAALGVYRRALELNRMSAGPLWRGLQLEGRIAACEGHLEPRPTLEIERDGRATQLSVPACVLGRGSRGADVIIPSATVGRQHCAIWFEEGGWQVRDLDTTTGTTINGVDLVGTARLESGAELRLGNEVVVHVKVLGDPCATEG